MDYTEVAQLESPFEAEMLKDALEGAGVPFIIHPHRETAYSGLFLDQRGWGSLLAPKERHAEAKTLLAEVRRMAAETGDGGPSGDSGA